MHSTARIRRRRRDNRDAARWSGGCFAGHEPREETSLLASPRRTASRTAAAVSGSRATLESRSVTLRRCSRSATRRAWSRHVAATVRHRTAPSACRSSVRPSVRPFVLPFVLPEGWHSRGRSRTRTHARRRRGTLGSAPPTRRAPPCARAAPGGGPAAAKQTHTRASSSHRPPGRSATIPTAQQSGLAGARRKPARGEE